MTYSSFSLCFSFKYIILTVWGLGTRDMYVVSSLNFLDHIKCFLLVGFLVIIFIFFSLS